MSCPVASANDNNTGGRVGIDRAQESEVLTRRDPGGSIRHCDRVKISRSDGYRPLKLPSVCDCIVEENGESSRHDHSRE
jgi:hypothetical protein